MGITHISPSDEDRRIANLRMAHQFLPNGKDMLAASKELEGLLPILIGRDSAQRASALLTTRNLLREIQNLCRSHGTVLKPFSIPADIKFCINLTQSLFAARNELSDAHLTHECAMLHARLTSLCANISTVVARTEAMVTPLPVTDAVVVQPPEVIDELFDVSELAQFEQYSILIPGKDSDELVKTLELPVMVTFNRFATVEELQGRGFDAVGVSGYLVLRGALFVAINSSKCDRDGLDEEKVLNLAMTKLTAKLGRLSLVREQGVRANRGGWMLYWYGTASYVNAMRGTDLDNPLIVTDFQFPFGGYDRSTRHQKTQRGTNAATDENPKRRVEDTADAAVADH